MRRSQQPIHVSANGIKGDVAQIQQAGIAHHNIQAECQHDVEHGKGQDADPCIASKARHKGQNQKRNTNPDRRPNGVATGQWN